MTLEVREGDRKAAFDAALNAYGPDSLYVPPLWSDFDRMFDPATNPFITEGHGRYALFSAHRDGRPVGRIAASIHDASNRKHGTRHGHSASSTASTMSRWPMRCCAPPSNGCRRVA
ncbi:hypothetical protein [Bradyrhizobium sp. SK17]|uniref:hypothetical protein n=1 Tax=Bradyrhizobium sp. SK17 TaxID=2057741 RepID=UPI001FDF198A|nr:hypothetical protein [Bradyrhizobium sp. SK17]